MPLNTIRYRQETLVLSHFDVRRFPADVTNQRHILLPLLLFLRLRFRVVVFSLLFLLLPCPVGRNAIEAVFPKAEDPVESIQRSGIPLDLVLFTEERGGVLILIGDACLPYAESRL